MLSALPRTAGIDDRGRRRELGTGAAGAARAEKARAPTKPIVIERLTHQDINDICALYKRVWDAFKGDLAPELVKAWQPTPLEFTSWMEGVTYFAARRDGRMIGAIGCEISDGTCRLIHLAVDPEARRQGVATALTHAAIEWARHSQSRSVWADALARFTEAAGVFKTPRLRRMRRPPPAPLERGRQALRDASVGVSGSARAAGRPARPRSRAPGRGPSIAGRFLGVALRELPGRARELGGLHLHGGPVVPFVARAGGRTG